MATFRALLPGRLFLVAPVMPPILGALFGAVADRVTLARGTPPRSQPRRSTADGRSMQSGGVSRPLGRESGTSRTQPGL